MQFRYGFDASLSYSRQKTKTESKLNNSSTVQKSTSWGPSVGGVIGLNYALAERVFIGAEMLPSIRMTKMKTINNFGGMETRTDNTRYSFCLSSSTVLLSLVYRF